MMKTKNAAYVITLTGPSGCGKSEIINILKEIGQTGTNSFVPVMIQKYTTRSFRENELESIKNLSGDALDVLPVCGKDNKVYDLEGNEYPEDIQMDIRKKAFRDLNCDLAYEQYGNQYGLHFSQIYECLKRGESPIIILNDVRTVEDIRTFLGEKCVSLFVFRKVPTKEDFGNIGRERKTDTKEIEARYEKAKAIYRIYIENIHLFDKLILNTQMGYDSLRKILNQLVDSFQEREELFVE